jgi:hypothetical protein
MVMLAKTARHMGGLVGVVKVANLAVAAEARVVQEVLMSAIVVVVAAALVGARQAQLAVKAVVLTICSLTLCLQCVMALAALRCNRILLGTLQPIFKSWA